jgi:fructan beta-fructosidase
MPTLTHRLLVALPLLTLTAACAASPSAESSRGEAGSGTVAAPAYQERYRPQHHFTPAVNWMNDPNGLVHFDGEYHLFYQYNPFGDRWGHMSWGHAVSPDLVHWRHLPVAIPEADSVMAFSGSAVVDWKNTSGFGVGGQPPLVAIYTGHRTDRPSQSQYIAYSTDRGRSWSRYAGNPVLDRGTAEFRDPKVFWYEPEQKWVMVVALPTEHRISLYSSPDLKVWTHMSDFGPAAAVGGVWECPDLFELPIDGNPNDTRWVLIVSLNPGGIAGGSGTQYFIGDFDGTRFTSEFPRVGTAPVPEDSALWADYGADYYAAVSYSDVPAEDGRRIWLGWMNNWMYGNDIPTSPWRSAQSLPRALSLTRTPEGLRLVQEPVAELRALRGERRALGSRPIPAGTTSLAAEGISGRALEIVAELEVGTASEVGLKVRTGENEETVIGIDPRAGTLFVDRTRSGEASFHDQFASRQTAPLRVADGRVRLHVFVDWSSVEVFAADGRRVITDQIFPASESDGVALYATGGSARLVSLEAWPLKSSWTGAATETQARSR